MMQILWRASWRWLLIVGLIWTGVSPASAQTLNVAEQVEALRIHLLTAQLQPDEAESTKQRWRSASLQTRRT